MKSGFLLQNNSSEKQPPNPRKTKRSAPSGTSSSDNSDNNTMRSSNNANDSLGPLRDPRSSGSGWGKRPILPSGWGKQRLPSPVIQSNAATVIDSSASQPSAAPASGGYTSAAAAVYFRQATAGEDWIYPSRSPLATAAGTAAAGAAPNTTTATAANSNSDGDVITQQLPAEVALPRPRPSHPPCNPYDEDDHDPLFDSLNETIDDATTTMMSDVNEEDMDVASTLLGMGSPSLMETTIATQDSIMFASASHPITMTNLDGPPASQQQRQSAHQNTTRTATSAMDHHHHYLQFDPASRSMPMASDLAGSTTASQQLLPLPQAPFQQQQQAQIQQHQFQQPQPQQQFQPHHQQVQQEQRHNPYRNMSSAMPVGKTAGVPKVALHAYYSQAASRRKKRLNTAAATGSMASGSNSSGTASTTTTTTSPIKVITQTVIVSAHLYQTWHNQGAPHELRWTSVFCCPETAELFFTVPYGYLLSSDENNNNAEKAASGGGGGGVAAAAAPVTYQSGFYWYSKKANAEHGAAAQALDCLNWREYHTEILLRQSTATSAAAGTLRSSSSTAPPPPPPPPFRWGRGEVYLADQGIWDLPLHPTIQESMRHQLQQIQAEIRSVQQHVIHGTNNNNDNNGVASISLSSSIHHDSSNNSNININNSTVFPHRPAWWNPSRGGFAVGGIPLTTTTPTPTPIGPFVSSSLLSSSQQQQQQDQQQQQPNRPIWNTFGHVQQEEYNNNNRNINPTDHDPFEGELAWNKRMGDAGM